MVWTEICSDSDQMIGDLDRSAASILLVRNDDQLRDFCRKSLERNGFQAIEAKDELDALLIAASREKPIELFVTDLEDPSISGIELASMLESISPEIKVLLLSGSSKKKKKAVASEFRRHAMDAVQTANLSIAYP